MKTEVIEIAQVNPLSADLAKQFKEVAALLSAAYIPVELEFAKNHHKTLDQDKFLNALHPYFQDGLENVSWPTVEAKLNSLLHQFFAEQFLKGLSSHTDICTKNTHYLCVARDSATQAPLAALYGWMNPAEHSCRIPIFGVTPKAQGQGLGRALLNSLFSQNPTLEKIYLSTRATNEKALSVYHHWGFTLLPPTVPNWVNLEYHALPPKNLQKVS